MEITPITAVNLTTTFDVISLSCSHCGISMSFDFNTLKKTLTNQKLIQGNCVFCHRPMIINKQKFKEIEENT